MFRLRFGAAVLSVAVLTGWLVGDDKKTDDKDPPVRVKGTLPTYYKKLGLSEDQTQKVYKIRGRYRAKIDALMAQVKELQQQEKADLENLLTEAQKARLKELRSGETAPKDKGSDKDKAPPATDKPDPKTPPKEKDDKKP
jgi:hypothetical protein